MRKISSWFGLTDIAEAQRTVAVVGCPFGSSDAFRGVGDASAGPAAIREWARTAEAITEVGRPIEALRVVDCGDADAGASGGEARWQAIESQAAEALRRYPGAFLLGLGGDHAVTPPLATAVRRAVGDAAFLLLDAHADCFPAYDGDPLAHACVMPRVWERGGFAPRHTCIAGVRSYAREEFEVMDTAGLVISAPAWHALGSDAVAAEILSVTDGRPLYISLDIDVLDPSCAPATGYPVAGGPGIRELLQLLDGVFRRQPVVALDLVEVAPALDPSGITAANAAHILLQVLGHIDAGNLPPQRPSAPRGR